MTKQHFVAIAESIKSIQDAKARKLAALAMVACIHRFNVRFNQDKFLKACGAG